MYNEKSDSFLMQIEHPSDVSAHEYLFSVYNFFTLGSNDSRLLFITTFYPFEEPVGRRLSYIRVRR